MNTESGSEKMYDNQETSQGSVFGNLSVNIPSSKSNKRVRATITSGVNDNEDFRYLPPMSSHSRSMLSPFDQTGVAEFLSNFELPFLEMFHGIPSSSGSEKRTPTSVPSPNSNIAEISNKVFETNSIHQSLDSFHDNLIFGETKKEDECRDDFFLDEQQSSEHFKSFESEDNRKVDQSSTGSVSSHLQDNTNDDEERRKREIRIQRNRESAMRSRIRKNNYIAELERRVENLTAEKMRLEGSILQLWMENEILKRGAGGSGAAAQHFMGGDSVGNVLNNPFLLSSFLQRVDPLLSTVQNSGVSRLTSSYSGGNVSFGSEVAASNPEYSRVVAKESVTMSPGQSVTYPKKRKGKKSF
ncbi:hypothetical protein GpartN1_g5968.t1 [Galdieria partita]|uniref:BZIP domain-containing protein n=1 Tax=Galdieria partita TaxID=83374 RepID=A0A9C7Q263_9RHOD|nr:hypothetical protein GpartN1_g5968.t1 [Galdieria partita]